MGRVKLLAGLRFLLFPALVFDALPAEFRLLLLLAVGLAGSAVSQKPEKIQMTPQTNMTLYTAINTPALKSSLNAYI